MPSNLFSKIAEFFNELRFSLADGLLFLGGPLDIIVALLDIAITALILYFILLLLRDSRAWQLLRGIILIVVFALAASALGLNTIGFMLNRTISILAIAIIVIFQPELRRTLEAVGRNRFSFVSSDSMAGGASVRQMIEAIVKSCEWMSETRTGALIIIERDTRLGELLIQENAVRIDANVTSALLRQIFYTGSPLHDGAVLIREGRISAARVHVPMSDNYHLRRDFGLRHRAAVGASEMGDAIAIVVSEERGSISLAVGGILHILSNGDALRSQLHRLLGAIPAEEDRSWFYRLRRALSLGKMEDTPGWEKEEILTSHDFRPEEVREAEDEDPDQDSQAVFGPSRKKKKEKRMRQTGSLLSKKQRMGLAVVAFFLACFIWLFVQVTVNPVTTRSFSVPLAHYGVDQAEAQGFGIQGFPVSSVQITLRGRQQVLNDISPGKLSAYIDVSQVNRAGPVQLPVKVDTQTLLYTKTELLIPATVTVNVFVLE
ncbi:MAG: TIGR00159 family protein [Clostridiaceae bacterium]|nr:TIGR00159 family protein [Clostridiaceae bacterium]